MKDFLIDHICVVLGAVIICGILGDCAIYKELSDIIDGKN